MVRIRGKAPLRISLAGGGTDLNYIFERYGGAVVSFTIDKYCHMSVDKRKDKLIYVNGKILDPSEILTNKVIEFFKPDFGFNLVYYNDIDPGSGLGSSSSFVVLLLKLLNELNKDVKSDEQLVKDAWSIEETIKEGGWQDQYATSIGGFNFMEFNEKTLIYPLRLRYRFKQELCEHLLLVRVKGNKDEVYKDIHKALREYSENIDNNELERTSKIKDLAFRARDCLLNQNVNEMGKILYDNWVLKRNKFTTNKMLDDMYEKALKNGAEGGKICGSGQYGHFLFFVKPENRTRLIESLGLEVVNFNLFEQGAETW